MKWDSIVKVIFNRIINKFFDLKYRKYKRLYIGNFLIRIHKDIFDDFQNYYDSLITATKLMGYGIYGFEEGYWNFNKNKERVSLVLEFKMKESSIGQRLQFKMIKRARIIEELSYYDILKGDYSMKVSYPKDSKEKFLGLLTEFMIKL
ncbi:hypothetical protein D3C75_446780 [compost metagenome]